MSNDFGRNLTRARWQRMLSGKQLAARLGISAALLSMIEHGRRAPSPALIERMAALFGDEWPAICGECEAMR
ncbi:MAG: helix-turn-helix domain-containing protein [Acidiferrobacteraceae bacterium]